jgi:hypothetical protein
MVYVIQMYLRNGDTRPSPRKTAGGSVAEKYHFLVVADFRPLQRDRRNVSGALRRWTAPEFTVDTPGSASSLPDGFVPTNFVKTALACTVPERTRAE